LVGLAPHRCARCFASGRRCFCPAIPRLETRTAFLIVRHAAERMRPSNTGRLAALALARAEVVDYALDARPFDEARLAAPHTWLLWPEGPPAPPQVRPARLLVLDGTWQQARRMRQRLGFLQRLPIFSLPAPRPRLRLRRPSRADGMSTLEAIAGALAVLEGDEVARPLEALYEAAVIAFTWRTAGR